MTLCIDIGNSRTTFGLLENGTVRATEHESSRHLSYKRALLTLQRLLKDIEPGAVTAAGIASVVPFLTTLVVNAATEAVGRTPVVISADASVINTKYDDPNSVGADRLCNAAAAYLAAQGAAIVVDCGTAATIDCVGADGTFLGGAILSGYRTTALALARATARLSDIELALPSHALGTSTNECLQSGVVLGTTFAIEGVLRRIIEEAYEGKQPSLLVTGGHHKIFSSLTSFSVTAAPDLVLQGIEILTRKMASN